MGSNGLTCASSYAITAGITYQDSMLHMHRSACGNDPELNQLPDAVIRRADEIAALAEDFVLPRPPMLSRDIILLATACARQGM